jgi:hypothetical protein
MTRIAGAMPGFVEWLGRNTGKLERTKIRGQFRLPVFLPSTLIFLHQRRHIFLPARPYQPDRRIWASTISFGSFEETFEKREVIRPWPLCAASLGQLKSSLVPAAPWTQRPGRSD